ncbi:MAG: hypothetical protein NTY02_11990 [Acidobacteria bacterium]|nr:hypothetical protein [Acidobacteriota bacterium]
MKTNHRETVRAWLAAERRGQDEEADRQFRRVAAVLPRLRPSAGFADAVLQRAGLAETTPDLWASWWGRLAVASALLSAGSLAVSLTPHGWLTAGLASLRAVAWGVNHGGAAARAWIGGAFTVWAGLAHAAVALGRLLAAPGPMLLLVLNLTVAGAALAALRRLLPLQEN